MHTQFKMEEQTVKTPLMDPTFSSGAHYPDRSSYENLRGFTWNVVSKKASHSSGSNLRFTGYVYSRLFEIFILFWSVNVDFFFGTFL